MSIHCVFCVMRACLLYEAGTFWPLMMNAAAYGMRRIAKNLIQKVEQAHTYNLFGALGVKSCAW